jgi:hypothetical protein
METTEKEIERVRLIHSCLDAWQSVVETSPRDTFTASMPDGSAVMFTRAEVREWPKLKARLVAELLKHPEWLYATPLTDEIGGGIIESSGISWGKKCRGRVMWRSMLPAGPAQEGWVPAAGSKVRIKTAWTGKGAQFFDTSIGEVFTVEGLDKDQVTGTNPVSWWSIHRDYLEPAALPDGKAGKGASWTDAFRVGEQVYINAGFTSQTHGVISEKNGSGVKIDGMWFGSHEVCPMAAPEPAKPDRYTQHREYWTGEGATTLKSWHENNPENLSARKRNIAALARELDQPSANRRARLHPHEGRSDRVYGGRRWE